jgi:NADH:ubiquinone oxidoreductase subunit 3 (subunit A)
MRGAGLFSWFIAVMVFVVLFFGVVMLYSFFFSRFGFSWFYREYYECGFTAVPDGRVRLDVQYALLVLFFFIYDMEIILLVPLLLNLYSFSYFGVVSLLAGLFFLLLSYWFEWGRWALSWGLHL